MKLPYPYDDRENKGHIGKIFAGRNKEKIESIANTLRNEGNGPITSDVAGSYTGMTIDGETPVQDADDL